MLLGAAHLVVAGRIDDVDQVEVSIADMTDQRRVQAGRLQVLLGLDDALGQPRDRHADVGRPALAAGPLCQRRIECVRSEEHTSELQSLMRISYAVFCLKKTLTDNTYAKLCIK